VLLLCKSPPATLFVLYALPDTWHCLPQHSLGPPCATTCCQSSLASLRGEHDAAQSALFEAQAAAEAAAGGRGEAEALLAGELERLQQQLAEALAGREAAAAALAAHQQQQQSGGGGDAGSSSGSGSRPGSPGPGSSSSSRAGDVVWQTRLSAAESAAASAQRAADAATSRAAQLAHDNQLLTSQVGVLTSQVDRLTRELARRPTPAAAAAMAQQMAALSLLVGQQLEAEGWDPAAAAEAVGACRPDSLAAQLAERNTKLTAALGAAKATAAQEGEARTAAEARLQELEASLADAQSLVTQLELDLAAVSAGGSSGSGSASGGTHQQQLLLGKGAAGGGGSGEGDAPDPAADGGEGGNDARMLLGVVVAQRDRLKQRVAKLEEEVAALTASATATQQQVAGLTADNVALVEKLRYLEAYRDKAGGGGSGGAGAAGGARGGKQAVLSVDDAGVAADPSGAAASRVHRYGCGPLALEIRGGGEGREGGGRRRLRADRAAGPLACWGVGQEEEEAGVEAKYRRAYEAKLNPWAGFQAAEVEAAKGALGLHDRALLAGSKLVVGSRMARVAIAAYAVVLHVFIMLLLYAASNRHAAAVVDASGGSGGGGAAVAVGPPEPRVLAPRNGTAAGAAAGAVAAAAAGAGRLLRRLLLGSPPDGDAVLW
jgi:homeobox protein cut-like